MYRSTPWRRKSKLPSDNGSLFTEGFGLLLRLVRRRTPLVREILSGGAIVAPLVKVRQGFENIPIIGWVLRVFTSLAIAALTLTVECSGTGET